MPASLVKLDYQNLAANELQRAAHCETRISRKRHLDRAALYAYHAEKANCGSAQPSVVLDLICNLSDSLDAADELGLTMAALHINQAIIALGGSETCRPSDDPISNRPD